MEELFARIKTRIVANAFSNENAVSQGIILPILRSLNWDDSDTSVVFPEFPLRGTRVDFALCPNGDDKPAIIIEVKRIGNLGAADEQLFNYAFLVGSGIAILTDGKEWHFYFPIAPSGNFTDRRFYKIDIVDSEPDEIVRGFKRYLEFTKVKSGQAFHDAKKDFEKQSIANQIERAMPEAWKMLVSEENPELLQVVSEKVADLTNYSPEREHVIEFLKRLSISITPEPSQPPGPPNPTTNVGDFILQKNGANGMGYPNGKRFTVRQGASFSNDCTPGCPPHIKEEREHLIQSGGFVLINGKYQLTRDYEFSSSSRAASVLLGQSASGNREWILNGRTLGSFNQNTGRRSRNA